jgi:hypothetical protein
MIRNNCCKNNFFFSYFSFQKLIKLFSLCEVGMSPTNFKLTISPNALAEAVAENSTLKEQLTVAQLDSTFYEREHNATWAALCSVRSTLDPGTEITAAVIALPAASRIFLLKLSGRAEKQGSYPPRRKARQLRRRASTLIELRTTLRPVGIALEQSTRAAYMRPSATLLGNYRLGSLTTGSPAGHLSRVSEI